MGTHRPNRYAGSRRPTVLSMTRLNDRVRKEREKKIKVLITQLNAFDKVPFGYSKIRHIYDMYAKLSTADSITAEWYTKFESRLPKKVRPSSVIAKATENGWTVDADLALSLRSLIVAGGPYVAPLVRFAIKHNLTEEMKFFVTPGDPVEGLRTCNIVSMDYNWECSIGRVPLYVLATAVANENNIVELEGLEGVSFNDPSKVNMLKYFIYRYPKTLERIVIC